MPDGPQVPVIFEPDPSPVPAMRRVGTFVRYVRPSNEPRGEATVDMRHRAMRRRSDT